MENTFSLPVVERLVRLALHHSCQWPEARPPEVESLAQEVSRLENLEAMSVAIAKRASRRHGGNVIDVRLSQWQRSTHQLLSTFAELDASLLGSEA